MPHEKKLNLNGESNSTVKIYGKFRRDKKACDLD